MDSGKVPSKREVRTPAPGPTLYLTPPMKMEIKGKSELGVLHAALWGGCDG